MTNTAVATLPLIGYSAVAFAGAVLVCLRLHRSKHCSPPHNSATVLLLLSRIGLLLLTIGTLIDDVRRVFGFIEPAKNDVAVGLSWFLECNHAIGCCVCTVIGFQLMSVSAPNLNYSKQWLTAALVVMVVCLAVGLYGFVTVTARSGMEVTEYMGLHVVVPKADTPLSLCSVIVTSIVALIAAVVLSCVQGWNKWFWLVACQLLGLVGQALLTVLNRGYEFYGSNFWEQVTIFSLVIADGILNEEEHEIGNSPLLRTEKVDIF